MAVPSSSGTVETVSIHPDTAMGTVRLTVADLVRSRTFYEQALGLKGIELPDGSLALSAGGGRPLLELHGDASAPPLVRRATGLFHVALLVPTRRELAFALGRLAQARWPLDGASDHLVSEALYLSDPDGNGIEVYRDRPREEWPQAEGQLKMATLPLDLDGLLAELSGETELQALAPAGAEIGHVHLQVSDLAEAEAFSHGLLGFDVTTRGYPGALFLSAGGYHHHLGLNTWHSAGAQPPPEGSIGLRSYEITLPTSAELGRILERLRSAGRGFETGGQSALLRDPAGNLIRLAARQASAPD